MRCIELVSPLSAIRLSRMETTPSYNAPNFVWSTDEDRRLRLRANSVIMPVAVKSSGRVFVSSTLPPPSPNLNVLLLTSAALLLLYWVTNFVVPDIVIKDLQSEDTNDAKNEE